ncbi:MAG TPA: NUMOD4 domain-containing protein [Bacteroidales bacterium]|nr:NUMOD4 domain-containing protein [Bacteroidales bacterium]HOK98337.1 NUMOD4 domain-containing protein [Bacteroidales bacterium]HPO65204.1 NUMOD4 domain-containing protein [Bacteroidales bacterium]
MAESKQVTDEKEVWKIIPYTDHKYEVSNFGRVKSYCQDQEKGKILKPSKIGGFYVVSLKVKGKSRHFLVHKLVAEAFVSKENDSDEVVIHLDWDKTNNYYKNLKWVSKNECYQRMHKKLQEDRKKKGKVVTYSKLKAEEVALIKSMLARGVKQKLIAKMFCVSEMQITRIKKGENWKEISPIAQSEQIETNQVAENTEPYK